MLHRLSDALEKHPRLFLVLQLTLLALCLALATRLEFRTSRSDLVGSDLEYYRNYIRFKKEFPAQEELVAVVESTQVRKNRQFVERLAAKLEGEPALFTNVFYKGDLSTLGPKGLLFLPEKDLASVRDAVQNYLPLIQPLTTATNLDSLLDWVNRQFRGAIEQRSDDTRALAKAVPALERIVEQALYAVEHNGTPPSPGVTALFREGGEAQPSEYLTLAEGRFFLVTVHARNAALKFDAVRRLRVLVNETHSEVPGNNIGVTGEPVLELDELNQAKRDTILATGIALVLSALIFICGYNETGRPLKATVCLLVGLGYTAGLAAITTGHLNILSITFAPILIGLAIDFGVHLVTRYEEDLRDGRPPWTALRKAIVFTGAGIFTGAFATAAAFFSMAFTEFKGIREMGVISGGGLLVCLLPMMTLLPLWLLRGRQNLLDQKPTKPQSRRARVEQFWLKRPKATVLICLGLTGLALTQAPRVRFEYNLLKLQTRGLPSVAYAERLMQAASRSVLFASVSAGSLDEAVALERHLAKLPSVASVEWMGQHLVEDQDHKLALVREIKQAVASIRLPGLDRGPVNIPALSSSLSALEGYLGMAAFHFQKEDDQILVAQVHATRQSVHALRDRLGNANNTLAAASLAAYQQALFEDLHETLSVIQNQDDRDRLRVQDLPLSLRNRFVGQTGRHLLQVYPRENVWQRDNQEAFVRELRTVAPEVTGTPVLLFEYLDLLRRSYRQAVLCALVLMALLVWLHFRSVTCVLLALLPVAIGTIWLLALMAVLDIQFNPANIMTVPLLIGIGVTNGIHILNRYAEERHPSMLARSTGKAVLVSALTTVAGFGSLMLARHQGIASLGYVMSIGVASCVIAALTFLPCVIHLISRRGWEIKKGPFPGAHKLWPKT
jgi:hopanoid biosynthesis associated RND transporter like protein HpnN